MSANKPLLPLFEAIVNSIQSIEDAKEQNGEIRINILRDKSKDIFDNQHGDILGFEVVDNGIGFNEENYSSFQTSDTSYKVNRGGKGIGRFLWLIAFDKVNINSSFEKDGIMYIRNFQFHAQGDGIANPSIIVSEQSKRETSLQLQGFRKKYRDNCRKKIETIATYIIEHCLEYFIRPQCPILTLCEKNTGETLNLNDIFEQKMRADSTVTTFAIKENTFDVLHVQLYSSHSNEHIIHYCAHSRVVDTGKLVGIVPNLTKAMLHNNDIEFAYVCYVESKYLDDNVNSERTDFNITKEDRESFFDEISWKQINTNVIEQCKRYLEPFLEPIKKRKEERIESFVNESAPMYKPIMKHLGDRIETLSPDFSEKDLDLAFYKTQQDIQLELKAEGEILLVELEVEDMNFSEYEERAKSFFEKVADFNQYDLARYVCHRKAIIEFLSKQLTIKADGKYRKEDQIHNLIFPMGKTSDEVTYEKHNLWLIDEKLVYHAFLSSDKPLKSLPIIETDSKKEPDIIIFDKACAFVTEVDPPFQSVVIIEIKRPMRDDYDENKNPISQVLDYIDEIKSGRAKTPQGRDVPISGSTPFYCYIVCDNVQKLEKLASRYNYTKTPDGQGYYGFNKDYNAYLEIISYTKMITDAKKRNAVFFNKLGLPSKI